MSNITAAAVASLRARTGVSMMECKKALEETGGDEEKAIEYLRKRGEAQAVKKADRDQGEGYIFTASGAGKVAMVLIRCETDFVSRSDDFQEFGAKLANLFLEKGVSDGTTAAEPMITEAVQQLGENISLGGAEVIEAGTVGSYVHTNGKVGVIVGLTGSDDETARDVAMHAAAMSPQYVSPEEVSDDAVAAEKDIWSEQLKSEGKPAEIMEKIMLGKEKKFREENALLTQPFVKNPDQTIAQLIGDAKVEAYKNMTV